MPGNETRHHIIAYDIGDPRRLRRIHRYLKKRAMPIQYSVFLIHCNKVNLEEIINDLDSMIDPNADDIRFYTLPKKVEIITIGQQGLGEGLFLLDGELDGYIRRL